MQKNLRVELLIFSRRPVGMNENDVNWSTFFALFFFCYLNISSMSNMSTLTNFTRIVLVCFLFVVRGSKIFNCFAVFLLSILIWMRSRKITVWIIDIPPLIRIFRSINSSLSDTMNDKAAHKNSFRAKIIAFIRNWFSDKTIFKWAPPLITVSNLNWSQYFDWNGTPNYSFM